MDFTVLLNISLVVCLLGLVARITHWFSQEITVSPSALTTAERISAAAKTFFRTLFSGRILVVLQSVALDLLLQQRILKKNTLRWLAHTLIFVGFVGLFFMHGRGLFVTEETLNPYLFLRNLFALMVLAGIGIAIYRRLRLKDKRLKSYTTDWLALGLVAAIMVTGIVLEGSTMTSFSTYETMVEDYGDEIEEDDELLALETYWAAENGLVSDNVEMPFDAELISLGQDLHSEYCMECHASNKSAFASYVVANMLTPVARWLDASWGAGFLRMLHQGACLALLIWLPFGKMFHILSAPISLVVRALTGTSEVDEASGLNRQMLGLSACTHCGTCSLECSANMFYEYFDNDFILPSEKIQYLKKIAAGKEVDPETRTKLQKGLYVCTSCDRCTDICPSGINLKEIFISARYHLLEEGAPEPSLLSHFSFPLALAQNFKDSHLKALQAVNALFQKAFVKLHDVAGPLSIAEPSGLANDSFTGCFACQRCTNICPVVRSYDKPQQALDMLPHQIIHSLGIGQVELAAGSQMIWSCSTCYLCQEHCPNQVELTDIFYNLKNVAIKRVEAGGKR